MLEHFFSPEVPLGLQGIKELINLHPLFVHFPVALLLASLGFYFLGMVLKKEAGLIAGKWALIAGTVSAALAVWSGLHAEEVTPHGGNVHELMEVHEHLGFVILGVSLILSLWVLISRSSMPKKGRALFFVLLLALNGVLIQSADIGGRMVFLNGVGVGLKSMLPADVGHHHHHDEMEEMAEGVHDHAEEAGHDMSEEMPMPMHNDDHMH